MTPVTPPATITELLDRVTKVVTRIEMHRKAMAEVSARIKDGQGHEHETGGERK